MAFNQATARPVPQFDPSTARPVNDERTKLVDYGDTGVQLEFPADMPDAEIAAVIRRDKSKIEAAAQSKRAAKQGAPKVIRMPDGTPVRFPADMPDEFIKQLIREKYPDAFDASGQPKRAQSGTADTQALLGELRRRHGAPDNKQALLDELRRRHGVSAERQPLRRSSNPMAAEKPEGYTPPGILETGIIAAEGVGKGAFNVGGIVGSRISPNYEAEREQRAMRSPLAAGAGYLTGAMASGGAAMKGAQAVPVVGKVLAPVAGQYVRNAARYVVPGAVLGGAQAGAEGEDIGTGAALGGAGAGVAVGAVKSAAAVPALVNRTNAAVRALARRLHETPEVLEAAYTNFRRITGRAPRVAEIVDLHSAGRLRELAADNLTIGVRGMQAVEARSTAQAERNLTAQASQYAPEDMNSLLTRRGERMDAAMAPIRQMPAQISQAELSMLLDPRVRSATNADPDLRRRLAELANGQRASLSVDDIDNIRKSLRGRQGSYANPQSSNHNPHIAKKYGELAESISQIASRRVPRYGAALKQFAQDSDYIQGFRYGRGGKAIADADQPDLIRTLDTPEGKEGYATGSTEYRASRNLSIIAPGVPRPAEGLDSVSVAHAVGAVATNSRTGVVYHLMRAIPGLHMSEGVQRKVADMLFDPTQTQAAIAALRRAGARDDAIRQLTQTVAAGAGAAAGGAQ